MEQHSVQVGTQYYRDSFCERLRRLQEQEKLPITLHEYQQGKRWLIDCHFQIEKVSDERERETTKKIHSYYLANALAETILQNWEKDHIRWLLRNKYKMKREETVTVFEKALQHLNEESKEWKGYRVHRKASLVNQIVKCLDSQQIFDVEGFLRFRAKDYREELHEAVAYVVNEHIIETEYVEFIELLKSFVDSQKPKLHTLHVGITKKGKFNLYNEEGKPITKKYMDELSFMDSSQELTYEDLLVSALIAVAPRKIFLHIRYEGYKDTLETIYKVFEGRVQYCDGSCPICQKI